MRIAGIAFLLLVAAPAGATTVVIANGAAQIALRVGATGGTISTVAFAPAAATAGTGVAVLGTTNAAAGSVQGANFPTACAANNVRIWAMARSTVGAPRTATLQVNGSINLTSGGNTIPLTDFDWVTSAGTEIASAAFSGSGTQALTSFVTSREVSVCLRFRFLNTTVYPSGTYTGQITYNLSMP
ncbi:hypothetical protein [Usitatibacter palustris]|uniref:Spore coat protein U (SCPU) domain-containing protein n=1 Tax=Usitatibacter palustris TaxID=2732487 RepID=A0A6M4H5U2_9PROT|nr:hypothetical protein [Usitatibacter palustris]QJR13884.1 hypothetical protein DSM104440_00674 [Usitatibacter palustris]